MTSRGDICRTLGIVIDNFGFCPYYCSGKSAGKNIEILPQSPQRSQRELELTILHCVLSIGALK